MSTDRQEKIGWRKLSNLPYWWGIGAMLMVDVGGCVVGNPVNDENQAGIEFQCAVGDVTPHEAVIWLKTKQPNM
jgi:hypothetical protein